MIAVIACMVGGLSAGFLTPLLSPVVYLLKSKREASLLAFSLYCIALGYEFEASTVYTESVIFPAFAALLPAVLLLDSSLRGMERESYLLALPLLAGFFSQELFILVVVLLTLYRFYGESSRTGAYFVSGSLAFLVLLLFLARGQLDAIGGASIQVSFIGGAALLAAVFVFMREEGRSFSKVL